MSRAHSPQDASLVLLGVFACGLISLLVGKASLGEVMEVQKQLTAVERERDMIITVPFCKGSPAFGAIKPVMGNVSAEKAKVESV